MQIRFYPGYAKEQNSTAIPADVAYIDYDCIIKEPFIFESPSIILALDSSPNNMRYCYIPDFNRYYFINTWYYSGGRWTATTTVDVLASNRAGILASSQYVLRSASRYDGNIADSYYPAKSEYQYTTLTFSGDLLWETTVANGSIIMDISGANNSGSLYLMSYTQYQAFLNYLFGNTSWPGIDKITEEISEELAKMLFNPLDYIASCRWYPVNYNSLSEAISGTNVSTIPMGWWSVGVSAKRIQKGHFAVSQNFTIPNHPQNTRGAWVNLAPYTTIHADVPPFGSFELPNDTILRFGNSSTFKAEIVIDFVTGAGFLRIYANNGKKIYETSSGVGVAFPLYGQSITTDFNKTKAVIAGASALLGNISTDNGIGDTIAQRSNRGMMGNLVRDVVSGNVDFPGAISDFVSGFLTSVSKFQTFGSAESTAACRTSPYFLVTYTMLVEDNNSRNGRPLAKNVVLSTLTGYCTCQSPHLSFPISPAENSAINSYLANGVFLE